MSLPVALVGEPELASIVDAAWTCALGVDDLPRQGPPVTGAGEWLRAGVGIHGAWDGVVTLECTRTAAVGATSSMLALSPEAICDADVHDALGELANVVGGGVKSLMPEHHRLTLPVVEPTTGVSTTSYDDLVARLDLTWRGEPVVVTVARTSPPAGSEPGRPTARRTAGEPVS
ncbi:MAG TPA: chemotaxis protein CheX [Actinomycetes bacterium]|nr:chemotaxis protein CheX [Actinomycetes bacterium]